MNTINRGLAVAAVAVGIAYIGATIYEKVISIKIRQNEISRLKLEIEKQEFEFKRKLAVKDDKIKELDSQLHKK